MFTSLVFLTSCWDRIEINDLAFVKGVAVDFREENEIEISVEVILPETVGGAIGNIEGAEENAIVETAKGKTLAEAVSFLQGKISRILFWGHAKGVILGDELVTKRGIIIALEYFARNPGTRMTDKVYVARDGHDLINIVPHLEESTMEALRELLETNIGLNVTVKDILEQLKEEQTEVAIPIVTISESRKVDQKSVRGLELNGSAIFKGDKKIGEIDIDLTRGLLWFRDEIEEAAVTLKPKDKKGFITMKLIHAHSELVPSIENGEWKISVEAVTEDDIIQNASDVDLLDTNEVEKLEKQLAEAIVERMEETRQVIQNKLKSDVLGFGRAFHRKYPDEWKKHKEQWDEIFPIVKVEYHVEAHIRRIGLTSDTSEFN
jgi:spore germination protein KC